MFWPSTWGGLPEQGKDIRDRHHVLELSGSPFPSMVWMAVRVDEEFLAHKWQRTTINRLSARRELGPKSLPVLAAIQQRNQSLRGKRVAAS